MWLRGWTPAFESVTSSSKVDGGEFHLVVKELQQRDIYVQDGNGSVFLLVLDPLSSPWLTLRGARKLLCPGVCVCVTGRVLANDDESSVITSDTKETLNKKQLVASSLVMTAALPASPYIGRLLSCPSITLNALFPSNVETAEPEFEDASPPISSLAYVLRPCSLEKCQELYDICQTAKKVGQGQLLFKNVDILQLTEDIRVFQGWSRPHRAAPTTSRQSWEAVLRMEKTWCRESDGTILHNDDADNNDENRETICQSDDGHRLIFGDVNVDPLLNLPDPTDERRVKYIEERKRPQIQWMLQLIQRVVQETQVQHARRTLQLVDVGGGRGDLSMALAASFAHDQSKMDSSYQSAHITVIDINQTSLEAGKARAAAAGLESYMSFVLCDLGDKEQIQDLLLLSKQEDTTFDLIFGLHCCGGVAEAAVELALTYHASFCVSTCCFRSNNKLASLSRLSEEMVSSKYDTHTPQERERHLQQHRQDRDLVTCLATIDDGQGQHCAIRAINAMRLVAAEERVHQNEDNSGARLKTWQESFPIQYSIQNRVMIGIMVECQ